MGYKIDQPLIKFTLQLIKWYFLITDNSFVIKSPNQVRKRSVDKDLMKTLSTVLYRD